jgi:hypothetical protein
MLETMGKSPRRFVTRQCDVCEWNGAAVELPRGTPPDCPWCHAPTHVVREEWLFDAAEFRAQAAAFGRMGGMKGGPERVGLGALSIEFHRLKVQASERADDLQVAQFLGADVHQEILAVRIVAIQALDGMLHRRASSPFAPPNCSSSMFPNLGSASSTRTVYISFFTW